MQGFKGSVQNQCSHRSAHHQNNWRLHSSHWKVGAKARSYADVFCISLTAIFEVADTEFQMTAICLTRCPGQLAARLNQVNLRRHPMAPSILQAAVVTNASSRPSVLHCTMPLSIPIPTSCPTYRNICHHSITFILTSALHVFWSSATYRLQSVIKIVLWLRAVLATCLTRHICQVFATLTKIFLEDILSTQIISCHFRLFDRCIPLCVNASKSYSSYFSLAEACILSSAAQPPLSQ
jgi:hypothetical protein